MTQQEVLRSNTDNFICKSDIICVGENEYVMVDTRSLDANASMNVDFYPQGLCINETAILQVDRTGKSVHTPCQSEEESILLSRRDSSWELKEAIKNHNQAIRMVLDYAKKRKRVVLPVKGNMAAGGNPVQDFGDLDALSKLKEMMA